MPERKLRNIREETPTITLRRSPRFLQANRTHSVDLGTQKLELTKVRHTDQILTPPGLIVIKSLQNSGKSTASGLKFSEKSRKGSGRYAELDCGANADKNETTKGFLKGDLNEKRVTRSSARGSEKVDNRRNECVSVEISHYGEKVRVSRKAGKSKVGSNLHDRCLGSTEKRITRSSSRTLVTEKFPIILNRSDDKKTLIQRGRGNENFPRKTQKGEKRKRCQVGEECEVVQGWTKEQALALRRAYFTSKPTPHFWKRVARMVPGKSAIECLNMIHSEQSTPPQPQTRSRTKRNEPSLLSFSASELLSPTKTKRKNLKQSKRKSLVAQKLVRQLLRKQQEEDQDHEADLFAVLEPKMDSSSLNFLDSSVFSTPIPNLGPGVLTRFRETSSSASRKQISKLKSSGKPDFSSPPVLKQIKNKAQHERYIDQLHCRDAKRKAESLRNARSIQGRSDKNSGNLQVSLIKVAKDALVFEAQDAINQFQSQQSSMLCDNIDDNSRKSDEDESDEDELL